MFKIALRYGTYSSAGLSIFAVADYFSAQRFGDRSVTSWQVLILLLPFTLHGVFIYRGIRLYNGKLNGRFNYFNDLLTGIQIVFIPLLFYIFYDFILCNTLGRSHSQSVVFRGNVSVPRSEELHKRYSELKSAGYVYLYFASYSIIPGILVALLSASLGRIRKRD